MVKIDNGILDYESKYLNGEVLINNMDITDEEELNVYERNITTKKLALLYLNPGKQTFDIAHYLRIHQFLFEDIYPFAGKIRRENIQKQILFCPPQFICQSLEATLNKARKKISKIIDKEMLLDFIVELHSDLDVIHPFREGNGRVEREFIRQYTNFICNTNNLDNYYLDYSKVNKEEFINAVIKADALVDYTDLRRIFSDILTSENEIGQKKK